MSGLPIGARQLSDFGQQIWFYLQAYRYIPRTILRYRSEVVRILTEISFGTGALAVVGGTVVITSFLTAFAGIEIGLQGYQQLSNIGVEALSGFVSAYINTRLAAPVIAGIALVATIGTGFTAQLGAMRISEEIDAVEVMGIESMPFLVTTRIIAGGIAIIPLYGLALLSSYASTFAVVTLGFGQSPGAYGHYFKTFLIPQDIIYSFIMVIGMALIAMTIHCQRGFVATGGPAGVGRAVGSAVRMSLVAVLSVSLILSLVLYGNADTLNISG